MEVSESIVVLKRLPVSPPLTGSCVQLTPGEARRGACHALCKAAPGTSARGPRQAGHGRQRAEAALVPPTGECTKDPGRDAWWSGPGWGCEWHLDVVTTTTTTTTANRYLREVEAVLRSLSGQTPPCTHISDLCTTHRPKRAHSISIVLR